MIEDDYPDTRLTFLILQDPTLFGNSDKLAQYDQFQVSATLNQLIADDYVVYVYGAGPKHPGTGERIDRSYLTQKGIWLFKDLQGKWRD